MLGSDLATISIQAEFCVREELVQSAFLAQPAVGQTPPQPLAVLCRSSFPRKKQKQRS